MEVINNTLYISYRELVRSEDNPAGVMSESYYYVLCSREQLKRLNRACYSKKVLIEFNSVPIKYRSLYIKLHGDPMLEHKSQSFVSRIKPDIQALETFTAYRYDGNKSLSDKKDVVSRYCNDAAILNALHEREQELITARATGPGRYSKTEFWNWAIDAIDSVKLIYPNTLPVKPKPLQRKYERYLEGGHITLIHAGYGNKNKHIFYENEIGEALMLGLLSDGRRFSDVQVAEMYNIWADANGKQKAMPRTVCNVRREYDVQIKYGREGKAAFRDKYDKTINRDRPSAPLLLINSDDNILDLCYIENRVVVSRTKKNGEQTITEQRNDFYRPALYVVLDAHCDYVLGYAVGNTVTVDLVRQAFRNAMQHIKELTGSYYLWHQLTADNWSRKTLTPYFKSLARTTLTEVGNARGKVIEAFFGAPWRSSLSQFPNYIGPNIRAKLQINPDFVKNHIASRPPKEQCYSQVATHIERMRQLPWSNTSKSRQQVWLENFRVSEKAQQRTISTETYLSLFGEEHTSLNTVTNKGILLTIGGEKIRYDIPKEVYRNVIGRKMQIVYDPSNLGEILVKDDTYRFTTKPYINQPMALADMTTGDGVRLQERLNEKKDFMKQIISEAEYRKELLESQGITAEGMLQAGVLIKEQVISATQTYQKNRYGNTDDDYDDDNFLSTFYSPKINKKQITQ